MSRTCIKVYFEDAEAKLVSRAAGNEAVSGFIRRTVLNNIKPNFCGTDDGVPRKNTTYGEVNVLGKPGESVVPPLPNPEKFPDGIEVCDHGATKNRCKVFGCYFYEVAGGRRSREQYELAKRTAPLFQDSSPGEANEVRESEDVRRDRDIPALRGRAAKDVAAPRASKKPAAKRTRRGSEEPSPAKKCEAAVGPGLYCPKCERKH